MIRARGFTLIELLAAMAILAVVSVMAVQALNGVFQQRSVLSRVDDRAAQLIRGLALLRQDMEAIAPWDGIGETPEAALVQTPGGVRFQRAGLARIPGVQGTGLGLVTWTLDQKHLTRSLQRDPEEEAPEAETILDGVTAFTLEPLQSPPDAPPGAGPDTGPDAGADLAPGYEIRLSTEQWGDLRLVVVP